MTTLNVNWIEAHNYVLGEDMPVCSRSEMNEIFHVDKSHWDLSQVPNNMRIFDTQSKFHNIEVLGTKNGVDVFVGYACPIVYVCGGVVYNTHEDCMNSDFYHPNDYVECRIDDVPYIIENQIQMLEDGCYGD
jgi:hypothetical protein